MRRRYRIVTVNNRGRQYLALVVEWQDEHRAWHSKTVNSYGVATPQAMAQAEADVQELQRFATDSGAPIPVGTINDAVWAGFIYSSENLPSVPLLGPALFVRDLIHLGAYYIATTIGSLEQKVAVTQPNMPAEERPRFIAWLQQFSGQDQTLILAYQWRFQP